jgi:MFS transporter, UMF1 family
MFGLFLVTYKGSAFFGPLILGVVTSATGKLRNGFYPLVACFAISIVLFYFVDDEKGKSDSLAYTESEVDVEAAESVLSKNSATSRLKYWM